MKESTTYVSPLTEWAPIIITSVSIIIIIAVIAFGVTLYKRNKKSKNDV
ncbi:hypothetical protein LRS37_15985 [Neobacillus sedimentimangrovi]|uniref:LPXTG cell wall anchor domain-containing protein n=1 Tax=Neobacillus sedimentimangrovi TaxID=2699460 RepID=A0ABS8QM36_9BACI|nr:hypothetical protein [Neobacillus sedimentimangrovi]MCD4840315.1 hypothetical protein [Neobacillus sedimentimangrovi]